MKDILKIGGREFTSRLFVGTGKFASNRLMLDSIIASGSQMVTVAMKRIDLEHDERDEMLAHLNRDHVQLLPAMYSAPTSSSLKYIPIRNICFPIPSRP